MGAAAPTIFPSLPALNAMWRISLWQTSITAHLSVYLRVIVCIKIEMLPREIVRWHETHPTSARNRRQHSLREVEEDLQKHSSVSISRVKAKDEVTGGNFSSFSCEFFEFLKFQMHFYLGSLNLF